MNRFVHNVVAFTAETAVVYASMTEVIPSPIPYMTYPDCILNGLLGALVGAMAPDIDQKIEKKVKENSENEWIPKEKRWYLGHRGVITHSLLLPFVGIICLVLLEIFGNSIDIRFKWRIMSTIIGWIVACISHITIDLFNTTGCPILFPFSKKNVSVAKIPVACDKIFLVFYIMVYYASMTLITQLSKVNVLL